MTRRNSLIVIAFLIALAVMALSLYVVLGWRPFRMEEIIPEREETEKMVCPLTGRETDLRPGRVPLAIAIDNIRQARPQSGLDRADIVYEVLAEGGIPRFLAIYYCEGESMQRIGPVRSARTYFISLAKQFDAVLVHAGGSPQALRQIEEGEIRSLDQFKFPRAYFRDPARRAPHNLFTSTSRLLNAAEGAGFEGPDTIEGPLFDADEVSGNPVRTINIPYPATRVSYEYDSDTGEYLRSMDGVSHRDAVTGNRLKAKNVVVQFAQHRVIDRAGRLEIDLVGDGEAIFFTSGRRVEGRWSRQSEIEPFRYEDSVGNPFKLAPGQTWVEIVRENMRITNGQQ
ncbi:MAG: DUF3048 domain-containing protein [Actinobacteria bacterium]|nr:DUF3048 domain-containing protein [Actinomycetota bacterium]